MKIKIIGLTLALCLTVGLMGGCGTPATTEPEPSESISQTSSNESVAPSSSENSDTRVFIDSAGREVTIPSEIKKIAPSGPIAQLWIYAACPDLLAGRANDYSEDAKQYIPEKYWSLPKFGQFYGKNISLNMEALIAESPDVIIDIGQAKKTIKEDMDALQTQVGIPTVFIEASLDTLPNGFTMIGNLVGNKEECAQKAEYCQNVLTHAQQVCENLPTEKRVSVYLAMGDAGLNTNAKGSFHAQVLDRVGVENVVQMEASSHGGATEVSLEQLIKWNPEIIIADSDALYEQITTDDLWKDLDAVKNNRIYRVPTAPYRFLNNPPSVNQIMGIQWLGAIAYPEHYSFDLSQEIKEFYKNFYHVDLSDEQLNILLKNAQ